MKKDIRKNDSARMSDAKSLAHRISPRLERLLEALLKGSLTREQADRVTGASNSPDYIRRLRHDFGIDILTCRECRQDRDGRQTYIGVYYLQAEFVRFARALIVVSRLAKRSQQAKE